MVEEIRLYVEGGGDGSNTKAFLREGFSKFLTEIVELARTKRIKWKIIACGGRDAAHDNFQNALKSHPTAFNILLVDSEGPVTGNSIKHLQQRDAWDIPEDCEERCHLMVQLMESWFLADADALRDYYGEGFLANALPGNSNIEAIAKSTVMTALESATRNTIKGKYHKTRDSHKILMRLNSKKVRRASAHCEKLFATVTEQIG